MNKREFLYQLEELLKGELPASKVSEYKRYYEQYIAEQMQQGKSEKQVLEELGNARLIAKSILQNEKMSQGNSGSYETEDFAQESYENQSEKQQSQGGYHMFFQSDSNGFSDLNFWDKVLFILKIVLAVMVVFALIGAIFHILGWMVKIFAPIIILLIIVLLVKGLFDR